MFSLVSSGRVTPPVIYEKVYSLETIPDGLRALENRETWGKAIVRIRDEMPVTKAKL